MDDATTASFRKQALALFRAGWDSRRAADRAMSPASGFGKYWASKDDAPRAAPLILRAVNAGRRAAYHQFKRLFPQPVDRKRLF